MKQRSRQFIRVISYTLVACFLAQDVLWANPEVVSFFPQASQKLSLPRISSSVAILGDTHQAQSAKTLYLIQDAHTNPSAQKNISKALEILLKTENIRHIFVESGTGNDSLSFLRAGASLPKRQEAAGHFLNEGLIGGEEYLDLTSEQDFKLWGVEDKTLYWQSIDLYRRIAQRRAGFENTLQRFDRALKILAPRILSPSLQAFNQKKIMYRDGTLSQTQYFDALKGQADRLGTNLLYYPHLQSLQRIKSMEDSLDFDKATLEEKEALKLLSENDLEEMAQASHEVFRWGSKNDTEEKAFFALLEEKLDAKLGARRKELFPVLSKYFDYLRQIRALDPRAIVREEAHLERVIEESLAVSRDEKLFLKCQEALIYWTSLLELSLTPEEEATYRQEFEGLDFERLSGFLNKKIMDLGDHYAEAIFLKEGFGEIVALAEEFYALTLRRDQVFVRKALEKMGETGDAKAVLITGGYHTPNLTRLLKDQNISFVVITPQVLQKTNFPRYEKLLLGQLALKNTQPNFVGTADQVDLLPAVERGLVPAIVSRMSVASGARLAESAKMPTQGELAKPFLPGARLADQSADVSPNEVEQRVRQLLNHYPNISEKELETSLRGVKREDFLKALESHLVVRMIPDKIGTFSDISYDDAGKVDWKPVDVEGFKEKSWFNEMVDKPWFADRLRYLEAHGNELRDLIHPIISEKIGTSKYALAIYGTFLFQEKSKGRDLDLIAVSYDPKNPLQIFGSQEIHVPGLSRLFPWLAGDYMDLNVINIEALQNSRSETSMSMLSTLSGSLFITGSPSYHQSNYMRLMHVVFMWTRQNWTFMREPKAFAPPKMRHRVAEVRGILRKILRDTGLRLNPIDQTVLDSGDVFKAGEYETVEEYYTRMSALIGNYVDLIEGAMKQGIRRRVLSKSLGTEPSEGKELKVAHTTPGFCQNCGISKYSMALNENLHNTPGIKLENIQVFEEESTKDPEHLAKQLQKAVDLNPDVLHLHYADGFLRKNKSEGFIEFTETHADILRKANAVVATIYELGPRMLSANRLPQNILKDTAHPERAKMMQQLRTEMKRLLNAVDGIIVHSEEQLRYIKQDIEFDEIVNRRGVVVEVMRHGIPKPQAGYDDPKTYAEWRKEVRGRYKIKDDQVAMIQMGFIRSNKEGMDILQLLKNDERLVWLLAGGPRQASHAPYRDELLERAKSMGVGDRVIATGWVPDEDMSKMYTAGDIAIVPYKTGSESYVLASGLGHGLPVVASALPFILDARRRYGDVVYRAANDEEFAREIKYLADHKEYREALGKQAAIALELDSWEEIAKRTKTFYEKVIQAKSTRGARLADEMSPGEFFDRAFKYAGPIKNLRKMSPQDRIPVLIVRLKGVQRLMDALDSAPEEPWNDGYTPATREIMDAFMEIGQPAIPALKELMLSEKNIQTRTRAAIILEGLGVPIEDPDVLFELRRWIAVKGLGTLAIPAMIKKLDEKSLYNTAEVALSILKDIQSADDFKNLLISQINRKNPLVLDMAVRYLGEIDPTILIGKLKDKDAKVRARAAEVLRRKGPAAKAAVPVLSKALEDEDASVRSNVAYALGLIGPGASAAVPALIEALKDKDDGVRSSAARALGQIGPEASAAVPAMIEALKDKGDDVRSSAARALGQIGPEASAAVPAMIEALEYEIQVYPPPQDKEMLSYVPGTSTAYALGQIGPSAIPALIEALKDKNTLISLVHFHVAQTLGQIGPPAIPALIEALKNNDSSVREGAAHALGLIGPEASAAVPALIEALNDHDFRVRIHVVTALGLIGPSVIAVIPTLIETLKDKNKYIQSSAVESLGQIGPEASAAVPALIEALRGNDYDGLSSIARALGKIGPPAIPVLIEALKDEDPRVRSSAAKALGLIGPEASVAVPAIIETLKDPDEGVGREATWALQRIDPKSGTRGARLAELHSTHTRFGADNAAEEISFSVQKDGEYGIQLWRPDQNWYGRLPAMINNTVSYSIYADRNPSSNFGIRRYAGAYYGRVDLRFDEYGNFGGVTEWKIDPKGAERYPWLKDSLVPWFESQKGKPLNKRNASLADSEPLVDGSLEDKIERALSEKNFKEDGLPVIQQIGVVESLRILLPILTDRNRHKTFRINAIAAIGEFGGDALLAFPILQNLMWDPEFSKEARAAIEKILRKPSGARLAAKKIAAAVEKIRTVLSGVNPDDSRVAEQRYSLQNVLNSIDRRDYRTAGDILKDLEKYFENNGLLYGVEGIKVARKLLNGQSGARLASSLGELAQSDKDRINALKAKIVEITKGREIEQFKTITKSGIEINYYNFGALMEAVNEGKVVTLDLSPVLEITDETQRHKKINSKFYDVANVLSQYLKYSERQAAIFTIMETLKNALLHGNVGDLRLPIFIYMDLKSKNIEFFDTAITQGLNARPELGPEERKALEVYLGGDKRSISEIKSAFSYHRESVRGTNGSIVGKQVSISHYAVSAVSAEKALDFWQNIQDMWSINLLSDEFTFIIPAKEPNEQSQFINVVYRSLKNEKKIGPDWYSMTVEHSKSAQRPRREVQPIVYFLHFEKVGPEMRIDRIENTDHFPVPISSYLALRAEVLNYFKPGFGVRSAPSDKEAEIAALIKILNKNPYGGPLTDKISSFLFDIGPESAQPLIKALESGDPAFQVRAAYVLGRIGPITEGVVPALLKALKSRDPFVAEGAARALGQIGPRAKEAVPTLREIVGDPHHFGPFMAATTALGLIGDEDPRTIRLLIESFRVGYFNDKPILETLAKLVQLGSGENIKLLAEALNEENSRIQDRVAATLILIGAPAVPYLIKVLKSESANARRYAADVLGEIGAPAKGPEVEQLLRTIATNDNSDKVRDAAHEAIRSILGKGDVTPNTQEEQAQAQNLDRLITVSFNESLKEGGPYVFTRQEAGQYRDDYVRQSKPSKDNLARQHLEDFTDMPQQPIFAYKGMKLDISSLRQFLTQGVYFKNDRPSKDEETYRYWASNLEQAIRHQALFPTNLEERFIGVAKITLVGKTEDIDWKKTLSDGIIRLETPVVPQQILDIYIWDKLQNKFVDLRTIGARLAGEQTPLEKLKHFKAVSSLPELLSRYGDIHKNGEAKVQSLLSGRETVQGASDIASYSTLMYYGVGEQDDFGADFRQSIVFAVQNAINSAGLHDVMEVAGQTIKGPSPLHIAAYFIVRDSKQPVPTLNVAALSVIRTTLESFKKPQTLEFFSQKPILTPSFDVILPGVPDESAFELRQVLEASLSKAGIGPEPTGQGLFHITLARVKAGQVIDKDLAPKFKMLLDNLEGMQFAPKKFTMSHQTLDYNVSPRRFEADERGTHDFRLGARLAALDDRRAVIALSYVAGGLRVAPTQEQIDEQRKWLDEHIQTNLEDFKNLFHKLEADSQPYQLNDPLLRKGIILTLRNMIREANRAREAKLVQDSIRDLKSQNRDVRIRAAIYFSQYHSSEITNIVPALIEALKDEHAPIRSTVALTLGLIGPEAKPAIGQLLEVYGYDKDSGVQKDAGWAIKQIDPHTWGPLPVKTSESLDEKGVQAVEEGDHELKIRIQRFIQDLKSENPLIREKALVGLDQFGKDAAEIVPYLIEIFGKEVPPISSAALDAVEKIGPDAIPYLLRAMHDGDERVRTLIVTGLGRIRPFTKDTILYLLEVLKNDDDRQVWNNAGHVLQKIGSDATPYLIEALKDENLYFRNKASLFLGEIGTPAAVKEAIPYLIKALEHDDGYIRMHARSVLARLGPAAKEATPDLIEFFKRSPQYREDMAVILGSIGPAAKAAIPYLKEALNDEREDVRTSAREAIEDIEGKKSGARLAEYEITRNNYIRTLDTEGEAARAMYEMEETGVPQGYKDKVFNRYIRGSYDMKPFNYVLFPDGRTDQYYYFSQALLQGADAFPSFNYVHLLAMIFYHLEREYQGELPKDPEERLMELFRFNNIKNVLEIGPSWMSRSPDAFELLLQELLKKTGGNLSVIDLRPISETIKKSGISYREGDARNLQEESNFGTKKFDLILSSGVISMGGVVSMDPDKSKNLSKETQADMYFDNALALTNASLEALSNNPKSAVIANTLVGHVLLERRNLRQGTDVLLWDNTVGRHSFYDDDLDRRQTDPSTGQVITRLRQLRTDGATAVILQKKKEFAVPPQQQQAQRAAQLSLDQGAKPRSERLLKILTTYDVADPKLDWYLGHYRTSELMRAVDVLSKDLNKYSDMIASILRLIIDRKVKRIHAIKRENDRRREALMEYYRRNLAETGKELDIYLRMENRQSPYWQIPVNWNLANEFVSKLSPDLKKILTRDFSAKDPDWTLEHLVQSRYYYPEVAAYADKKTINAIKSALPAIRRKRAVYYSAGNDIVTPILVLNDLTDHIVYVDQLGFDDFFYRIPNLRRALSKLGINIVQVDAKEAIVIVMFRGKRIKLEFQQSENKQYAQHQAREGDGLIYLQNLAGVSHREMIYHHWKNNQGGVVAFFAQPIDEPAHLSLGESIIFYTHIRGNSYEMHPDYLPDVYGPENPLNHEGWLKMRFVDEAVFSALLAERNGPQEMKRAEQVAMPINNNLDPRAGVDLIQQKTSTPSKQVTPSKEPIQDLAQDLKSLDHDIRLKAVYQLSRSGFRTNDIVLALTEALKDEYGPVRFASVLALGRMGSEAKPAIGTLMGVYGYDKDPKIQQAAGQAINKIDPQYRLGARLAQRLMDKYRRSVVVVNDSEGNSHGVIVGEDKKYFYVLANAHALPKKKERTFLIIGRRRVYGMTRYREPMRNAKDLAILAFLKKNLPRPNLYTPIHLSNKTLSELRQLTVSGSLVGVLSYKESIKGNGANHFGWATLARRALQLGRTDGDTRSAIVIKNRPLSDGISGAPIFWGGELIGLSAWYDPNGKSRSYAMPASTIRPFYARWMREKHRREKRLSNGIGNKAGARLAAQVAVSDFDPARLAVLLRATRSQYSDVLKGQTTAGSSSQSDDDWTPGDLPEQLGELEKRLEASEMDLTTIHSWLGAILEESDRIRRQFKKEGAEGLIAGWVEADSKLNEVRDGLSRMVSRRRPLLDGRTEPTSRFAETIELLTSAFNFYIEATWIENPKKQGQMKKGLSSEAFPPKGTDPKENFVYLLGKTIIQLRALTREVKNHSRDGERLMEDYHTLELIGRKLKEIRSEDLSIFNERYTQFLKRQIGRSTIEFSEGLLLLKEVIAERGAWPVKENTGKTEGMTVRELRSKLGSLRQKMSDKAFELEEANRERFPSQSLAWGSLVWMCGTVLAGLAASYQPTAFLSHAIFFTSFVVGAGYILWQTTPSERKYHRLLDEYKPLHRQEINLKTAILAPFLDSSSPDSFDFGYSSALVVKALRTFHSVAGLELPGRSRDEAEIRAMLKRFEETSQYGGISYFEKKKQKAAEQAHHDVMRALENLLFNMAQFIELKGSAPELGLNNYRQDLMGVHAKVGKFFEVYTGARLAKDYSRLYESRGFMPDELYRQLKEEKADAGRRADAVMAELEGEIQQARSQVQLVYPAWKLWNASKKALAFRQIDAFDQETIQFRLELENKRNNNYLGSERLVDLISRMQASQGNVREFVKALTSGARLAETVSFEQFIQKVQDGAVQPNQRIVITGRDGKKTGPVFYYDLLSASSTAPYGLAYFRTERARTAIQVARSDIQTIEIISGARLAESLPGLGYHSLARILGDPEGLSPHLKTKISKLFTFSTQEVEYFLIHISKLRLDSRISVNSMRDLLTLLPQPETVPPAFQDRDKISDLLKWDREALAKDLVTAEFGQKVLNSIAAIGDPITVDSLRKVLAPYGFTVKKPLLGKNKAQIDFRGKRVSADLNKESVEEELTSLIIEAFGARLAENQHNAPYLGISSLADAAQWRAQFHFGSDGKTRAEALKNLALYTKSGRKLAMHAALNDKDPQVRASALGVLGNYPSTDKEVESVLIRSLERPFEDKRVHYAASYALFMLNSRSGEVRKLVLDRLSKTAVELGGSEISDQIVGRMGGEADKEAVQTLIGLFEKTRNSNKENDFSAFVLGMAGISLEDETRLGFYNDIKLNVLTGDLRFARKQATAYFNAKDSRENFAQISTRLQTLIDRILEDSAVPAAIKRVAVELRVVMRESGDFNYRLGSIVRSTRKLMELQSSLHRAGYTAFAEEAANHALSLIGAMSWREVRYQRMARDFDHPFDTFMKRNGNLDHPEQVMQFLYDLPEANQFLQMARQVSGARLGESKRRIPGRLFVSHIPKGTVKPGVARLSDKTIFNRLKTFENNSMLPPDVRIKVQSLTARYNSQKKWSDEDSRTARRIAQEYYLGARLGEQSPEDQIPALIERLKSPQEDLSGLWPSDDSEQTTDALVKIGQPTIPFLKEVMNGNDKEARNRAARTLDKLGVKIEDVELLYRWGRYDAIEALGVSAIPVTMQVLNAKFGDYDYWAALRILEKIQTQEEYKKSEIELLKSQNSHLVFDLVNKFGDRKDRSTVEPLIEMLKDKSERYRDAGSEVYLKIRAIAARSLGEIGDSRAIESLVEFIENDSKREPIFQIWAIEALAKLDAKRAAPYAPVVRDELKREKNVYSVNKLNNILNLIEGSEEKSGARLGLEPFFIGVAHAHSSRINGSRLALDLKEDGSLPYIFSFTKEGESLIATAEGLSITLDRSKLKNGRLVKKTDDLSFIQDLRTLTDSTDNKVISLVDASGIKTKTPVIISSDLSIIDNPSSEFYLDYLIATLKALKKKDKNVFFILKGPEHLIAQAKEKDNTLFLDQIPQDLKTAPVVNLTPSTKALNKSLINIPVTLLQEGDIPAFKGLLALAVASGRISTKNIPQGYQDAYSTLAGLRLDTKDIKSILEGTADQKTVLKGSLKAITKVAINKAIQLFKTMIRMVGAAA